MEHSILQPKSHSGPARWFSSPSRAPLIGVHDLTPLNDLLATTVNATHYREAQGSPCHRSPKISHKPISTSFESCSSLNCASSSNAARVTVNYNNIIQINSDGLEPEIIVLRPSVEYGTNKCHRRSSSDGGCTNVSIRDRWIPYPDECMCPCHFHLPYGPVAHRPPHQACPDCASHNSSKHFVDAVRQTSKFFSLRKRMEDYQSDDEIDCFSCSHSSMFDRTADHKACRKPHFRSSSSGTVSEIFDSNYTQLEDILKYQRTVEQKNMTTAMQNSCRGRKRIWSIDMDIDPSPQSPGSPCRMSPCQCVQCLRGSIPRDFTCKTALTAAFTPIETFSGIIPPVSIRPRACRAGHPPTSNIPCSSVSAAACGGASAASSDTSRHRHYLYGQSMSPIQSPSRLASPQSMINGPSLCSANAYQSLSKSNSGLSIPVWNSSRPASPVSCHNRCMSPSLNKAKSLSSSPRSSSPVSFLRPAAISDYARMRELDMVPVRERAPGPDVLMMLAGERTTS